MIFVRETRAKVWKKYPDMHALEIMKKVGNIWQNLSPQDKTEFEDEARVDKQRFLKELINFKKELEGSANSIKDLDLSEWGNYSKNTEIQISKNKHSQHTLKKIQGGSITKTIKTKALEKKEAREGI